MRIEAAAGFGSHVHFFGTVFEDLGNQAFATAVAIHIGRIYKIAALVYGRVQCSQSICFTPRIPSEIALYAQSGPPGLP